MEIRTFSEIFKDIFQKNNLESYINDDIISQFAKLTDIIIEVNAVMNITAITDIEKMIPLHYTDCVKIADRIPKNSHVIDIGCGGGFPILPLAIVRPDITLLGVDSTEKKVRHVQQAAQRLNLSNVTTISGRAENLCKDKAYRENFDVCISRAVARLNVLDELCLPFIRAGGKFIAMKGAAGQEELQEAENGIHKLGGNVTVFDEYDLYLTDTNEKRTIVEVQKILQTPSTYPRVFGTIKKKPL